jgi:hypothetical protein
MRLSPADDQETSMPVTVPYLQKHVFCRCGQAVSGLAESTLTARPQQPRGETLTKEWWIVSAELAILLRAVGSPVLRFGDMHLWGRSTPGLPLQDDLQLLGAISPRSRPMSLRPGSPPALLAQPQRHASHAL